MADSTTRRADLRRMLLGRRRDMQDDVQTRIRDRRVGWPKEVGDHLDESDANVQGEIDLALLQMRTETVARIDASLERLESGKYGYCVECERTIAARRLRALPFALRCQECEKQRERKLETGERLAQRDAGFWLFPDVLGP
jgi:RNA polymerase-binding transcription factor